MPKAQLRQTYYDKVYNYRPAWIVRWGIFVIFAVMMLVFAAAWFVEYPDIIDAAAEVTTINPPSHIAARVSGKITKLWVADGDNVEAGERLAMLETTVSWDDVSRVRRYIRLIDNCMNGGKTVQMKDLRSNLRLGELQQYYNALIANYNEYAKYRTYSYTKKEIASTERLLSAKYKYYSKQKEQKNVYNEIYSLSETDHLRDEDLYESDVISASEMGESTMGLLQKEATLKDLDLSVAGTVSEIRQMEYNIEVLKAKDEEECRQLIVNVRQAVSQLSSQIDIWQQNYVIAAPSSGKVTFTNYWAENQNINAGDIILSVVPTDSMQTKVRVQFPMHNAGKVRAGQRVNIKLENYPYAEFGFLQGKVAAISSVPDKNYLYSADVTLDKGFITSYNKKLDSSVFLKGVAEIMTDDYSLLLRLFNPLKAFMDEKIRKERDNDKNGGIVVPTVGSESDAPKMPMPQKEEDKE